MVRPATPEEAEQSTPNLIIARLLHAKGQVRACVEREVTLGYSTSVPRSGVDRRDVVEFFAGSPEGLAAYQRVCEILEELGDYEVRVTKSQIAFRRKRGFAYLWTPARYLRRHAAPVVLSIALDRRDGSDRFKEVVHPSPSHWMHHLEIHVLGDIDDDVIGWLAEAAQRAG